MKSLLFLVTISLFIGCKKDVEPDKTSELLSRTWKLTAWNILTPLQGTPLDGRSPDWYNEGCYSDVLWTYEPNGELDIQQSAACSPPGAGENLNDKWSLENGNKEIRIINSLFGTFTYSIVSVNEVKLVVNSTERVAIGGSETIELLMQREYTAQ